MMFFAPASYIGVSYYQGENGLEKFMDLFKGLGIERAEASTPDIPESSSISSDEIIKMQAEEITILKQRIKELEDQLAGQETESNE